MVVETRQLVRVSSMSRDQAGSCGVVAMFPKREMKVGATRATGLPSFSVASPFPSLVLSVAAEQTGKI